MQPVGLALPELDRVRPQPDRRVMGRPLRDAAGSQQLLGAHAKRGIIDERRALPGGQRYSRPNWAAVGP
jgi:hypothetical protein